MLKKQKSINHKKLLTDYFLTILIELIILFSLIFVFYIFIHNGPLIGECEMVGDEQASPTMGRLLYMYISFVVALVLGIIASKCARINKDRVAFFCGFTSGILLWQAIGEAAWHFSVGGVHFVQLESIVSLPLVVMFVILLIYGYANKSFDWGAWCVLTSFACNWIGHYVTIGIYPFISNLIDAHNWNVCSGITCGSILFISSIWYLKRHSDTLKGRLFAALLTYIAIGVISLSMIDG